MYFFKRIIYKHTHIIKMKRDLDDLILYLKDDFYPIMICLLKIFKTGILCLKMIGKEQDGSGQENVRHPQVLVIIFHKSFLRPKTQMQVVAIPKTLNCLCYFFSLFCCNNAITYCSIIVKLASLSPILQFFRLCLIKMCHNQSLSIFTTCTLFKNSRVYMLHSPSLCF